MSAPTTTTTYDRIVARRVAEALDGLCSATAEHTLADGSAIVERCIYPAGHTEGHGVRVPNISNPAYPTLHAWPPDEWQHVCSVAQECP